MTDRPSAPNGTTDTSPLPAAGSSTVPSAPDRPAAGARRQAVLSLAVGLLLLVSAPVAWFALRPDPAGQQVDTVGADRAAALQAAPTPPVDVTADAAVPVVAPTTAPAATAIDTPVPSTPQADPAPVPAAAPAAPPAPAAPADPTRIRVPALGVDASVVPIGVQASGELEIPADVATVGWYRYGPTPGNDTGSAVLSGHVDAADQGPGTFARLGDLQPGDAIEVTDSTGASRSFSVVAREEWQKADVPLDRIFDRGGEGRLVLITCGGAFDRETLGYQDNIAVTAVLSEG
ncbi:class F sortase [Nakamurella flavida]|uniref:Class F sortase n=1 Tax=Nakamurella flavida TaxID=363630 RepID=A0A939C253_9ACTN|nr:class F sortase [Nakamurella flavida]MBM9475696.1 class F sortase [Nakamurella flavida]MDP9778027.1 hypothetical protein [Nakamurella flavida]